MNIIFAGTPEFAKIQLQALINANFNIVAVYTQPDRPVGRGLKLQSSAVKQAALQANLPVEQPLNFKSIQAQETLRSYHPDLIIVSAYGLLLPKIILEIPTLGCWNVHASLLPHWRGAAPIQHAILAGDTQTGITLMQMNEGLDTGDILASAPLAITPTDTSASVHEKLAHLGADLLLSFLKKHSFKNQISTPQDNTQATLAPKINKLQAKLDWTQDATSLVRAIHAFNPWPVAHTNIESITLKIWDAEVVLPSIAQPLDPKLQPIPGTIIHQSPLGIDVLTGAGILRLTQIQLPDKRKMPVCEVLKSKSVLFSAGNRFN